MALLNLKSFNLFTFLLTLFLSLEPCALILVPTALQGQSRPKVGLVLSGGGAAGLAHIGAIRVLEEAGIPIDYVAGTSMGSIVGGMFAMGYTAAEMEKLVKEINWESLLADVVPRNDLTFEYKEQLEKYFYDFPISKGKLQLPTGLIAGTNITNLLAGITWPAYKIKIFNQLPRPFLCIGADVVTGQEVVLSSGNLHDALRASMAIPTVFTPVEVNGKLLIDGGFINNFPADHLKEMGADIIIGIDVQRELYKKTELHSLITILKQISTLTREDINARNRLLCDILIRPNTPGASTLTFGMADSIIRTGERYARAQWITLKKLADKLNTYSVGQESQVVPLPKVDSLFVREIAFTGLEKVNPDFVQSRMNLPFPAWLRENDIFRAMQRVYGTNEFTKITYQLDPVSDGVRLTVRAEEKEKNLVHVGLHFDNLFNASLLARADLRNLLKPGDQLGFDINLGENPNLNASYFFLFRKRHQYGLIAEVGRLRAYEYKDNRKISSQIYRNGSLDFVIRTTWRNQFAATLGIQGEIAGISPNIGDWNIQTFSSKMVNLFIQLKKDNFNKIPYPTQGEKAELMIKEVNNFTDKGNIPALIFDFRYRRAFELSPKWSLQPSVIATFALGDSIPYPYRSYIGGLGYYHKSVIPFAGMDYMERASNHALIVRADLQYRLRGNHYLVLKLNAGKSFNTLSQFNYAKANLAGIGLTYGYSSPIGPVEVTLMGSTTSKRPILFINLGYWIR
ncbi:MAG: patatin-like phospholipase family protein [Bacteroidia bacterium]|nr:patatin-like phospholipase family protein [Bacteroidia bacterium]